MRSDGTLSLKRRRQEREEAKLLVQTVPSEASSRSGSPCVTSGLSTEGEAKVLFLSDHAPLLLECETHIPKPAIALCRLQPDLLGDPEYKQDLQEHLRAIYATPCGVGVTRIREYLDGLPMPRLMEAQSEELEGEVSLDDLVEALGGMASGKAPGPDGLTVKFY
ncbi:hypothetical protein NDU88_008622 [Pleurodeles waltl]|uniref:Uncharacterized protein n=1 Tax=Pleurodeles waltl TaxID=8319 RepID=A0AAV7P1F5_PLEWA|nr:hypothetical protein NDU88_008618 [Pleurodeles waltl]KAJ1120455.1 hypothetical protein NDU88_008620 [Pleurodeles waltl]KAJ1120457.1 hypothetical protein NDU88_008622 [Pleurodeles waltl]